MSKPLRSFRMAFSILKHLAVKPTGNAYSIARDLKVDRPTVRAALKILASANLVSLAGKPKKLATGLERKEYKVTPQGIIALLQAHPDHISLTKRDLRDLAAKQVAFLPMIFGKWETFQQRRVADVAYEYLMIAVQHTEDEIERLSEAARGRELKKSFAAQESMHRHDIYETMLLRAPTFGTSEADAWGRLVRNDKELRAMAEKEIFRLRGEAQEGVRYWDSALRDLHGKRSGVVTFVASNPDEEATWEEFEEWWRYARAKALDEGKPLPSPEELTRHALVKLLESEGMRVPKKMKARDRKA